MKKNYLKKIAIAFVLLCSTSINAQTQFVNKVIILNEGRYDYVNMVQATPVTISSYDPGTKDYVVFDTIQNARYASDVKIFDNYIYVAADTFLIAYDKDTYQEVRRIVVPGIRKIAEWNDKLLISRGDVVNLDSYFEVFNKSDLSLNYKLDNITGPKYSSEGIAVYNDTAYLAINNGYEWGSYVGKLGIIDLNSQSLKSEVDLGADGINPDNLMADNGKVYTLNNKDFSSSSISIYDPADRSVQTTNLMISTGCGTSVKAAEYIYYQEFGSDKLARFSVNSQSTVDTVPTNLSFYGMITDDLNGIIYATSTDYASYGKAYIMNYAGTLLDSFNVGISPGNLALDVRALTGINENASGSVIKVYPNPARDNIYVQSSKVINSVQLYDLAGRLVKELNVNAFELNMDISSLAKGIYTLNIQDGSQQQKIKLVKN